MAFSVINPAFLWKLDDGVGAVTPGDAAIPAEEGNADGNKSASDAGFSFVAGGKFNNALEGVDGAGSDVTLFLSEAGEIDPQAFFRYGFALDLFVYFSSNDDEIRIRLTNDTSFTETYLDLKLTTADADVTLEPQSGSATNDSVTYGSPLATATWHHLRFTIDRAESQAAFKVFVNTAEELASQMDVASVGLPKLFTGDGTTEREILALTVGGTGTPPFTARMDALGLLDTYDPGDAGVIVETYLDGSDLVHETAEIREALPFASTSAWPIAAWYFNDDPLGAIPSADADVPEEAAPERHTAATDYNGNQTATNAAIADTSPKYAGGQYLVLAPSTSAELLVPNATVETVDLTEPLIGKTGLSVDFVARFDDAFSGLDATQRLEVQLNGPGVGAPMLTVNVTRSEMLVELTLADFTTRLGEVRFDEPLAANAWHHFRIGSDSGTRGVIVAHLNGERVIYEENPTAFKWLLFDSSVLFTRVRLRAFAVTSSRTTSVDRIALLPVFQTNDYLPSQTDEDLYRFSAEDTPAIAIDAGDFALPAGTVVSYAFTATGGTAPYEWFLADGVLPSGLSLAQDGTLSGTVEAIGEYDVVIRVVDAVGAQSETRVRFVVVLDAYGKLYFTNIGVVPDGSATIPEDVQGNMDGNTSVTSYMGTEDAEIINERIGHSDIGKLLRLRTGLGT